MSNHDFLTLCPIFYLTFPTTYIIKFGRLSNVLSQFYLFLLTTLFFSCIQCIIMFLLSPGKKGRKGRDQKTIHRIKKYQKDVWQVLSCVQYILSYVIINPNTHGPFYVKILAAYVKIYPFVHSVDNRKA